MERDPHQHRPGHASHRKKQDSLHRFDDCHKPIHLLTYNVFMRPVVGMTTDLKDTRVPFIAEAIRKYDVVCFQELFSQLNYRRKDILNYANRCGFKHVSKPPDVKLKSLLSLKLLNSGLLTISKYPIVETEFIEFKEKAGVDALAAKGVLYSKIKTPNHRHIHLFNTHTQATYHNEYQPDNKSDHKNFLARLKQLEEIRVAVDKCLNTHSRLFRDGPDNFKDLVLVVGDFNVNSRGKPLPADRFAELAWVKKQKLPAFLEYDYLTGVLSKDGKDSIEDLAFEAYGSHPVTFGDVEHHEEEHKKRPREVHLTNPDEFMSEQSLDYIFRLTPFFDFACRSPFKLRDCRVNEFFAQHEKFTQLSDHYGLEVAILLDQE